jgi:hypothetical protein
VYQTVPWLNMQVYVYTYNVITVVYSGVKDWPSKVWGGGGPYFSAKFAGKGGPSSLQ